MDTTRTIASLIVSETATKCPDVRFIFSHAGGTLVGVAGRLLGAEMTADNLAKPRSTELAVASPSPLLLRHGRIGESGQHAGAEDAGGHFADRLRHGCAVLRRRATGAGSAARWLLRGRTARRRARQRAEPRSRGSSRATPVNSQPPTPNSQKSVFRPAEAALTDSQNPPATAPRNAIRGHRWDAENPADARATPASENRSDDLVRPIRVSLLAYERMTAQACLNANLIALPGVKLHLDKRGISQRLDDAVVGHGFLAASDRSDESRAESVSPYPTRAHRATCRLMESGAHRRARDRHAPAHAA